MEWFQASLYIGASVSQRAVASSMTFLHSLRGKASRSQHFFDTAQEAREFLSQERSLQNSSL
jgi:hypothetical protein